MNSTVGWSDLLLFEILENGHIAADQEYFYEFNSKKSNKFGRGSGKVSTFKIHRGLKIICFPQNLQISSLNIFQRTIVRRKFWKFCCCWSFCFQNGQNCFWNVERKKTILFEFLFIFCFTKIKEDIPPGTGSKNVLRQFFVAHFSQHFLSPCAKLKSNIYKWNFGIGVL